MPDIKRYGVYVAALVVAVAVLFATRFYYQGEIAQLKLDYAKLDILPGMNAGVSRA